jgi:signal transduction histidine kinase
VRLVDKHHAIPASPSGSSLAAGFLLGVAAAGLPLLWRRTRITRLGRQDRLDERKRIARILHDTFLQDLQALVLRLDGITARLAPESGTRLQLERALHAARTAIEDGRAQVLELSMPAATCDLPDALARTVASLRTDDNIEVTIRASGIPARLAPESYVDIQGIAVQALANAFFHARPSRIDVSLTWRHDSLTMAVRDDGIGLDDALLVHGRPGHWGLVGMRERAAAMGATLAIGKRRGGGTEVVLTLPCCAAPRTATNREPASGLAGRFADIPTAEPTRTHRLS